MRSIRSRFGFLMLTTFGALLGCPVGADEARGPGRVTVLETPDGGIQPQAVIDDRGVIHLLFYKGDPAGGDLFYTSREPGADRFAAPVPVNSQPGSAIAIGTIRGGQIALGRVGRIHVAWNGSNRALPKSPPGGSPMLFARSREERGQETQGQGLAFEPQRNLMQRTSALDGGGTIAADREGNVHVAWHARTEDSVPGESGRRMWVARFEGRWSDLCCRATRP